MTFWNLNALELAEFRPGIKSIAEVGSNLVMAFMEIAPKKEDTGHKHPYEQCGLVLEGSIEMFIGEERRLLSPLMCYFIPSGELHGWKTFEAQAKILDITLKQP